MKKTVKREDGKYECPMCDYGHDGGRSRQAVTKHFNAAHGDDKKTEEIPSDPLLEGAKSVNLEPSETLDDGPEWLKFAEFSSAEVEDDPSTVSVSPLASTLLRGMVSDEEPPSSPKAMREYYQQQGKMMRWLFSGFVDPLFAWYGRGVTADDTFAIERSTSDWTLFEDAASNWCEYRGVSVPVTPDIVMIGTVASFYAPVVTKIHRQRDPSKPSLWRRWKARRAVRKALKAKKEEASE